MDTSYYKKYEPIFGEWSIVREIGEGSFGKVFEIERRDFGYTYKAALKAITIPQSQSEVKSVLADGMDEQSATSYFRGFVEEMVAEFVLMSKLKGHSNIVSYEDHRVVEHTEGIGWDILIRMELLTPLLDHVSKNPLSRGDVIKLGIDICKALEVCRKNNIIHRDIKPENIFYSDIGDFKLGDFGIAKTVEKTTGGLSKKGTYTYMAPEVYKGEAYGASVDIYSLGIVLYRFMNNNRTPFLPPYPTPIKYADRESAMARRIKGEALPAPANADEALSRVILKACAYSPKDRYLSPSDMRRDLEALLGDVEQQPGLDKTVGVFSGKGTAKVDAPVTAPTDVKEPEPASETAEPVSKTAAFFAEPLPTVSDAGTVGIFSGSKDALKDETVGIFNSNRASNTEQQVADSFDKAENPPKRQVHRSFAPTSESDRNALMEAVKNGDVSAVSELLAKGVDPNCERMLDNGNRSSALYESIAQQSNDVASGTCGNNLKWSYDSGTLIISGKGEMDDYGYYSEDSYYPPWHLKKDSIKAIIIEQGVTSIGEHAFSDCTSLLILSLPRSLKSVGFWAFSGCEVVTDIYYAGSEKQYWNIDDLDISPMMNSHTLYPHTLECPDGDLAKLWIIARADYNYDKVFFDEDSSSTFGYGVNESGNNKITKLLIDAGADVNYVGFDGSAETPLLFYAIRMRSVKLVEYLLRNGANPNSERVFRNGSRYSALIASLSVWRNNEIARLLIGAGADVNYVGSVNSIKLSVLSTAVCTGNTEMVDYLIRSGADINSERVLSNGIRSSALDDCIGVMRPNYEIAKLLIDLGADVNYDGTPPEDTAPAAKCPILNSVVCRGNLKLAEYLLLNGADPNSERTFANNRYSALSDSIMAWPNDDIAKLLIDSGADVNYIGLDDGEKMPVLFDAIRRRNVKIVRLLLNKGADPNAERIFANGNRRSTLTESITKNIFSSNIEKNTSAASDSLTMKELEIATLLIEAGANVNCGEITDGSEISVLCSATVQGKAEMVKLLLSKGADPNCERVSSDGSRYSALLDSICNFPNDEITNLLIDAGADVNYVGFADGIKYSVLHAAISQSNVDILKLMLSKGANPCCEIVSNDGSRSSALRDCILRWPNAQIIDLLCSYMNPLPDDVRGLKVKRSGLSAQTIQNLKAAGCKVSIF